MPSPFGGGHEMLPTMEPQPQPQAGQIVRPDAIRVTGQPVGEFPVLRGDRPDAHFPEAARKEGWDGAATVGFLP